MVISTKGLFLVLLTFVNNLSYPAVAVNIMNITGSNYRTNFLSYFLSFRKDFLFDISTLYNVCAVPWG